MNEHAAVVIQQLAEKLGTTSEYLWAVLIKQAPIAGAIVLAYYAVTVLALVLLWRFRAAIASGVQAAFDHGEGSAALAIVAGTVFGILALIWGISCLLAFENMLTAFLNPEYWALDKVLSTVKAK